MPASRRADYLVARVREQIRIFGANVEWVDGFSAATSPDTSLLAQINLAQGMLIGTRYSKTLFTVALTGGTTEYTLPATVQEVTSVWYGNNRLIPTSVDALDARVRDWRGRTAGTPTRYYIEGRTLGLTPKPSTTNTLNLRGIKAVADLAAVDDVPELLPPAFHDLLIWGASYLIACADKSDRTDEERARLKDLWDGGITALAALVARHEQDEDARVSLDEYALPAPVRTEAQAQRAGVM